MAETLYVYSFDYNVPSDVGAQNCTLLLFYCNRFWGKIAELFPIVIAIFWKFKCFPSPRLDTTVYTITLTIALCGTKRSDPDCSKSIYDVNTTDKLTPNLNSGRGLHIER